MARSHSRSTRVYTADVVSYSWPETVLLGWRAVMYGAGGTLIGVFASFLIIQQQLGLGIPWILPYGVTVGAITIVFLFILDTALMQRTLLPGLVGLGAFALLVLYLAGLVGTAIQLFGASSNVNGNCQTYVFNNPSTGVNLPTFTYIAQKAICQSWQAAFAFWIIGVIFLVYILFLAMQMSWTTYTESHEVRERWFWPRSVMKPHTSTHRTRIPAPPVPVVPVPVTAYRAPNVQPERVLTFQQWRAPNPQPGRR